jgi:2-keto-4-pentenoate hydratase/2-oxohepta-3-ene-1,7-dioic acid hydratase in catechol pathway
MKLASIRHGERERVVVAVDDTHVIDANDLLTHYSSAGSRAAVTDMLSLIERSAALLPELGAALESFRGRADETHLIPTSQLTWRPPVRRPGKICGVAMNNSASNARKISAPSHPAFFLKPASCLVGHLEPIRIHDYYGSTHPEPELAVVIGRRAREISVSEALGAVFGYTIFNDITSNGMRAEDLFHYYALYASRENPEKLERVEQHLSYAGRYKGSDTFGPMGPWLVTSDAVPNPDDLDVSCRVAGELVAEDSTRYFNYNVAEVLAFISRFQTLEPGDVVSMGTAFKAGASRKSIHTANLARTAGPVEVSITGLGTLSNPVEFISTARAPASGSSSSSSS